MKHGTLGHLRWMSAGIQTVLAFAVVTKSQILVTYNRKCHFLLTLMNAMGWLVLKSRLCLGGLDSVGLILITVLDCQSKSASPPCLKHGLCALKASPLGRYIYAHPYGTIQRNAYIQNDGEIACAVSTGKHSSSGQELGNCKQLMPIYLRNLDNSWCTMSISLTISWYYCQ